MVKHGGRESYRRVSEIDYLILHVHKSIDIIALISQGSHIPSLTAGNASLCYICKVVSMQMQ